MKHISIVILILVISGCSNLDLATYYSPPELKNRQTRKLEGLSIAQIKANPLKSYSLIYVNNPIKEINLDGNIINITFSAQRKIVILPGEHKLYARKVHLTTNWGPFRSYMYKLGYIKTSNGNWVQYYKGESAKLLVDPGLRRILSRGYFYYPITINFTTEAGKIYYLDKLIYNEKLISNKEFNIKQASGHFF